MLALRLVICARVEWLPLAAGTTDRGSWFILDGPSVVFSSSTLRKTTAREERGARVRDKKKSRATC